MRIGQPCPVCGGDITELECTCPGRYKLGKVGQVIRCPRCDAKHTLVKWKDDPGDLVYWCDGVPWQAAIDGKLVGALA